MCRDVVPLATSAAAEENAIKNLARDGPRDHEFDHNARKLKCGRIAPEIGYFR